MVSATASVPRRAAEIWNRFPDARMFVLAEIFARQREAPKPMWHAPEARRFELIAGSSAMNRIQGWRRLMKLVARQLL
jgi:hypothetical protein